MGPLLEAGACAFSDLREHEVCVKLSIGPEGEKGTENVLCPTGWMQTCENILMARIFLV